MFQDKARSEESGTTQKNLKEIIKGLSNILDPVFESDFEELDRNPWMCYLRPAPPGISLDTHYTYNQVLETIDRQRRTPKYCYYCYRCPLRSTDVWERHVVRHHPGELAYPGAVTRTMLEIIEENERRNKTTVVERSMSSLTLKIIQSTIETTFSHDLLNGLMIFLHHYGMIETN